MTARVPKDILHEYLADDFSDECCFCGSDRPQLHHNLIHGGRQVQETWAFLPLCKGCHDQVNHREFRRLADWVMLNRANDEQLDKYSKVMNYKKRRDYLNIYFGKFRRERIKQHYEELCDSN